LASFSGTNTNQFSENVPHYVHRGVAQQVSLHKNDNNNFYSKYVTSVLQSANNIKLLCTLTTNKCLPPYNLPMA